MEVVMVERDGLCGFESTQFVTYFPFFWRENLNTAK